jgi:hypothetical protein
MQESLIAGIIAGIIGGLITSAILFIGTIVWTKKTTPWIENLLYRDAQIEGTWIGILMPYIGLDEIDKMREKYAWNFMKQVAKERKKRAKDDDKKEHIEEKELAIPQFDQEGKVVGELILPEKAKENQDDAQNRVNETSPSSRRVPFTVVIKREPIEIKVELRRIGHSITGRVIEVGGASNICSYTVKGEFRNLILACIYETEAKEDIDRGSCSLMLKNNGKNLEGFFSSYSDDEHSISPLRCILRKQSHFDLKDND